MSAGASFATGFLKTMSGNIKDRKDEAKDYFDKRMEQAYEAAQTYKTQNQSKLSAHLQTAKQLIASGVPEDVVMAVANQNPDDLPQYYELTQQMRTDGVPMTPEAYRSLVQIDGELNAGGENVTSLLHKIYMPLSNNAKSDPQGWDFDPKGTIWATMMGYNAMERAQEKLSSTEVLPGVSAAQVLADTGMPNTGVLGDATVTLNAEMIGNETRAARERNKGDDGLSISNVGQIHTAYEEIYEKKRDELMAADPSRSLTPEMEAAARQAAAQEIYTLYPQIEGDPRFAKIIQWIGDMPSGGSESPATAPVAPPATTLPETPVAAPPGVPAGSQLVKEWPNGDKGYVGPDGKKYIVKSKTGSGPTMRATPQPGYLDRLGSEYD